MPTYETRFGPVHAGPQIERHSSGALKSCITVKESPLATEYGTLVPQFTANSYRKRQFPIISFHESGMLNVLPLEEQTVVPTPLGEMLAEKLVFYPDGALKRIFPLDGCLSGFWEQSDERSLAHPLKVETPVGPVEALILAVYFSPKGDLRSLTLWPGEEVDVPTPVGMILTRVGMAFHDSGALKSVEPNRPTVVRTPIGEILAFNPDANGITGDSNSICFGDTGDILSVTTVSNAFVISGESGSSTKIEPPLRINPLDGENLEPGPLTVSFEGGYVRFSAEGADDLVVEAGSVLTKKHVRLFSFSAAPVATPCTATM